MNAPHERAYDAAEIIRKLRTGEFAPIVNALANDRKCYTQGGRVNVLAVSRVTGIEINRLTKMMARVRVEGERYF